MKSDPFQIGQQAMMIAREAVSPKNRQSNLSAFLKDNHPDVPTVVYHGTADDITQFQHSHPNKKDAGWLGKGFYFTNNKSLANSYSMLKRGNNENVMPIHLSLKNPFQATMEHKNAIKQKLFSGDQFAPLDFTNELISKGHDGVVLNYGDKEGTKEYVVFNPTQIKSAIGNNGDYDPTHPDITKASGGMVADPKKAARAALYVARKTFADGGDAEPQSITSADTSIKQVPAVFKNHLFSKTPGQRNLDIGGGKYDLGREYLAQHGVESHVYDPYNREPEHNEAVLKRFSDKPADSVTATNVLNVIQHPHHRAGVIEMAHRHLDDNGHAYFGIYAGDRSGQGKQTSKGYQNNLPASAYMDEVQRVFPHVQRKGDVIVARKKSFASGGATNDASPAVAELKHLLTMHRDELRRMKGKTQYAAIDAIMKRISREHGIAPSKLHDDWMSVYHQTPDAWVAGDHGNVVDHALKMTSRGGYAFGGGPAGPASATGAPINFAPAAGAFTGLPSPESLNLAPSKATLAAILASRPTTYTGSSKPLESKYIGPSIAAPTFNASLYNLPDNPLEEDQGGGYGSIGAYGGGGNGAGGGGGAGGIGGGGQPSARGGRIHRADGGEAYKDPESRSLTRHTALPGRQHTRGRP